MRHVHGLGPHLRIVLALVGQDMAAGVVEDVQPGEIVMVAADRAGTQQRGLGVQRVVIGELEFQRVHRLQRAPGRDRGRRERPPLFHRAIRNFFETGSALVRAQRIGQHHGVRAGGMREVVVDAFLLHQSADEAEVVLAVLHAIVALGVIAAEALLDVRVADLAQHGADDLGHAHLAVDAAVDLARQQPGFGHQGGAVDGVAHVIDGLEAGLARLADDAVEMARIAVFGFQRHRHRRTQQLAQIHLFVAADHLHAITEQLPELLGGRHALEQQLVAEISGKGNRVCHVSRLRGNLCAPNNVRCSGSSPMPMRESASAHVIPPSPCQHHPARYDLAVLLAQHVHADRDVLEARGLDDRLGVIAGVLVPPAG